MANLVAERPAEKTAATQADKTWVYMFSELDKAEAYVKPKSWDDMKALLGGKGANLFEMTRLGVPVPPGFTVTTEACNAYLAYDRKFPPGQWEQEVAAMHRLEKQTGKHFGDPENPLTALELQAKALRLMHEAGLSDSTAQQVVDCTLALARGGSLQDLTEALAAA